MICSLLTILQCLHSESCTVWSSPSSIDCCHLHRVTGEWSQSSQHMLSAPLSCSVHNGGYNASISVQTPIFHLVVNSTRLKTVRSPRWCCHNSTMAPRLLENVVKVTNLEVVKIVFRHLPFLILLLLLLLQPA